MATISSAGIGSGLDVESIVSKLLAIEQQPITVLKSRASNIESQISQWGKLQSALSALKDASDKLNRSTTWAARSVASSDPTAVSASVTASGSTGQVSVRPTQLAAAQSVSSVGFAAKTDIVGTGSLSIDLGSWGTDGSFTAKPGSTSLTIDLSSGTDTLEDVRDKINGADAGVNASIVYDGSAYRMVLSSTETGAANAFRVSATDSDGNGTDAAGLSRLSYDASGASAMTRNVVASDAVALVNNLEIRSSSNTFDQALEGVSFSIGKTSGTDVILSLTQDKDSMKKVVDEFVTAYNAANAMVRSSIQVDPTDSSKNGPLQTDATARNLQYGLRTLMRAEGPTGHTYSRLSDIGFDIKTDGSISVDSTKMQQALAQPAELRRLLAGDGTPGSSGVATQISEALGTLIQTDGSLKSRSTSLQDSLKRNEVQQTRLEDRLTLVEKRLRAQYTALDTKMSNLSTLSTYIAQQVTAWNKN